MKKIIWGSFLGLALMNFGYAQENEQPTMEEKMAAVKKCKEKSTEDEQSACILDVLRGSSSEKPNQ